MRHIRDKITLKILKNKLLVEEASVLYLKAQIPSSDSTPEEMALNLRQGFVNANYQHRADMANDEDLEKIEREIDQDSKELQVIINSIDTENV